MMLLRFEAFKGFFSSNLTVSIAAYLIKNLSL